MKKDNKVIKSILNLDVIIASVALIVLITFTFGGIIMRYVVGKPLGWIEEIQLFCIVWVVFAAGGAAFRTGSHVAIEVLVEAFPKIVQKLIEVLIGIIVILTLAYLFKTSLDYMQLFIRTGRGTSVLKIPYSLIYIITPVSCILQVINYFLVCVFGYGKEERIEEVAKQ